MTFIYNARKKLRLPIHNYNAGLYFVTLCTQNRYRLFGKIHNFKMELNDAGKMVKQAWFNLPNYYKDINLDSFVIMPDHVHAIIHSSLSKEFAQKSLSDIIRNIKSYTTICYIEGIKKYGWPHFEKRLWQRSFHEHIIRNESSLNRIRQYIMNNSRNWK